MKRKILNVSIICAILGITCFAGYQIKMNEKADLPVFENTSIYPEFSFPDLVNEATYILNAEVIDVGDSFMKEIPVSLTENPNEATEILSYPVTPITLKVETPIKGNISPNEEYIYYEDGGITDTCIILPSGYAMEEGYKVILFLNDDGYCWGEQSIYPIVGDHVILNEAAMQRRGTANTGTPQPSMPREICSCGHSLRMETQRSTSCWAGASMRQ